MIARKILETVGIATVAAALVQLPSHAAIDLQTGAGTVTYAKETLGTAGPPGTVTSGADTYYVLHAREGRERLSFTAPVGSPISPGGTLQVRFNLEDMVFAGATLTGASLTIDGKTAATATLDSGGASSDTTARFTITAGASESIAAADMMRLSVRNLGVLPNKAGTVMVAWRPGSGGTFTTSAGPVTAHGVASALREEVTPASPITEFVDGFRSFGGKLVASLGRLLVRGPDTSKGEERAFDAATSTPVTLGDLLGSGSTVTFSGRNEFIEGAFLSEEADCTNRVSATVLSGGTWQAVSLDDANERHLCIEVDGVTSIPSTTPYGATLSYTGATGAAFPPDSAEVVLGSVVREGVSVFMPYVNTHANVNFRVVITNRTGEPVPYRFDFTPPDGTSAVGGANAEGTLPANSLNVLRAATVVTVTGRRTYTGASLTVGGPPDGIDIVSIQVNRSDGSTDTVSYWPEREE